MMFLIPTLQLDIKAIAPDFYPYVFSHKCIGMIWSNFHNNPIIFHGRLVAKYIAKLLKIEISASYIGSVSDSFHS